VLRQLFAFKNHIPATIGGSNGMNEDPISASGKRICNKRAFRPENSGGLCCEFYCRILIAKSARRFKERENRSIVILRNCERVKGWPFLCVT
jgi:hypothetical protein